MADSIMSAMDAVAAKKESLQKAYLDLESHSSALVNFKIQWKELQDHFDHVEELMRKRAQELGIKLEEKSNVKPLKPSVEVKKSPEEKKIYNPDVVWKTPRPAFKSLCEKMDAEGLKKFIVDNKKDQSGLRYEAPGALRSAPRPAELVLKVLEGFYTKDKGGKPEKDVSLFIQKRRAGVLLLETLPAVVEAKDVPLDVKKAAKKVADDWKGKIGAESGEGRENYLEAHAFLQLLASYGIGSEFNDDFLGECVVAVCRRKQAPELCRTLGLTGKMPEDGKGVMESDPHKLAQRQKQIGYGKNTVGYQRYVQLVPLSKRKKQHPATPNIHQVCSKRSWDGQVKKWRRCLHHYDPPPESGKSDRGSSDSEETEEGSSESGDSAISENGDEYFSSFPWDV